uniref:BRCT domain-containing protein n=1 Tax=Bionectria ochroleuca TaxID=29856 RepID=A0A8H7NI89_BIOOC
MVSPNPNDDNLPAIDPAEPFKGLVVCCTSISSEHRIQIAQQVVDLGGVHKLDLTPDVTHLIVGEYDTPKYRHVARHRQDIKAMDAAWVHSVSDLWKNDEVIDFYGLEEKYRLKTFESRGAKQSTRPHEPLDRESLRICLSGFGEQNDEIAAQITANGGSTWITCPFSHHISL